MKLNLPNFDVSDTLCRVLKSLNVLACKSYYGSLKFKMSYLIGGPPELSENIYFGLQQYIENKLDLSKVRRTFGVTWRDDLRRAIKFHFARIVYFYLNSPKDIDGRPDYSVYSRIFPEPIPNVHYQMLRALNYKNKSYLIDSFGELQIEVSLYDEFVRHYSSQADKEILEWTQESFRVPKYQHFFSQLKQLDNTFDFPEPILTRFGDNLYCIGQYFSIFVRSGLDQQPLANAGVKITYAGDKPRITDLYQRGWALDSTKTTRTSLVYNYFLGVTVDFSKIQLNQSDIYNLYNQLPMKDNYSDLHNKEANMFLWGIEWPTVFMRDFKDFADGHGDDNPPLPPGFSGGNKPSPKPNTSPSNPGKTLGRKDLSSHPIDDPEPSAPVLPLDGSIIVDSGRGRIEIGQYPDNMRFFLDYSKSRDVSSYPITIEEVDENDPALRDPGLLSRTVSILTDIGSSAANVAGRVTNVATNPSTARSVREAASLINNVSTLLSGNTLRSRLSNLALRQLRNFAVSRARRQIGLGS